MKMDLLKKKKMLLTYALAMSLSAASLTGCVGENKQFYYTTEENGDLLVEGTISFDMFKELKLIHLTNELAGIDKYILAKEYKYTSSSSAIVFNYVDMENGRKVYDSSGNSFKNFNVEIIVDIMYDYIYKYDMIKDSYDIEDIKKIKEYLLNDETLNIGKSEEQEESDKEEARVLRKSKKYC